MMEATSEKATKDQEEKKKAAEKSIDVARNMEERLDK